MHFNLEAISWAALRCYLMGTSYSALWKCVLSYRQPVLPHGSWDPVFNERAELKACRSKSGVRLPRADGHGAWIRV